MLDFVKVGKRICEYRKKAGLSQDALAERLYVTRQAVSKWEKGLSVPALDTMVELTRLLAVPFEVLVGIDGGEKIKLDEDNIFAGHDRSYIIEQIVSGEVKASLPDVLWQMSPAERMYILKHVKDGELKVRMRELLPKLTPSEQKYILGGNYAICEGSNRRKRILPHGR